MLVTDRIRHHSSVLELRIVVPTHLTAATTSVLDGHPGVVTLSLTAGSSVIPQGDVITATVLREAADMIISELREVGVDSAGTLSVVEPRLVLSRAALAAEGNVPGSPVDTVIWDEVSRRTSEDASLSGTYLILMIAATMIAGIGVMSDSPILIVAAMVVGPDFGPTAATAVGIASRRWGVARAAFATLMLGFLVGIVATFVMVAALAATHVISREEVLAPRPQTAFIYEVGWTSVIVAAIAGVVGMISLTTAKSGALVGVFISVTTVPAAANVAVAFYYGLSGEARGSLAQLLVNILTIQIAAGLTLLIQHKLTSRNNQHIKALLGGSTVRVLEDDSLRD